MVIFIGGLFKIALGPILEKVSKMTPKSLHFGVDFGAMLAKKRVLKMSLKKATKKYQQFTQIGSQNESQNRSKMSQNKVPRKIIKNVTFGTLLGAISGAILVTFGTMFESIFDVLLYFLGFFGTVVSRAAWIMLARTFRICVCTFVHLLGHVVFICVHILGIWLTPLARCLAYVRKVLVVVSVQFWVDFLWGQFQIPFMCFRIESSVIKFQA